MLKILLAGKALCEPRTSRCPSWFRKGRGTRDQIANIHRIMEKPREFQKTSTSASLKAFDCKLLANSETESLLSYDEIKHKIQQGQLNIEETEGYLAHVSTITWTQIGNIIKRYYTDYPNSTEILMDFICLYRYDKEILTDQETYDTIKRIVLAYPIDGDNSHSNYKYAQYVKYLLEDYHDDGFAIAINKKLIKDLSKGYFHNPLGYTYNPHQDIFTSHINFRITHGNIALLQ